MLMPGGLFRQGKRHRDFAFKPISGEIELAIYEAGKKAVALPQQVNAVLLVALDHLGGQPPSLDAVRELTVGDRQYLMRMLLLEMEIDNLWLKATCHACGELFNLQVNIADLPIKEANEGFPYATTTTSAGKVRFRTPTGADQEWLLSETFQSSDQCTEQLVLRCISSINDDSNSHSVAQTIENFTRQDFSAIEEMMEKIAPEITNLITTTCPECQTENHVHIDPYYCLTLGEDLYNQIHILATTYHWSEEKILSLPSSRRRHYTELIDRSRGMMQ